MRTKKVAVAATEMKEFEYSGLHFTPLAEKARGSFCSIMRRVASVGIGNYPWSSRHYDYDEFYRRATPAGGGKSDLFRCRENGLVYIPCANELMLYLNKSGSAYRQ